MNRRTFVSAALLGAMPILICLSCAKYINSFATLVIDSGPNVKTSIYLVKDAESGLATTEANAKLKDVGSGTYKVKKGSYVYISRGNTDEFKEKRERFELNYKKSLAIELDYSDSRLSTMLPEALPRAKTAFDQKYPKQANNFTLSSAKLYGKGDWLAAKLVPNNKALYETYSIVFKKNNNQWSIVTDPPEIIISKPVYPEIPDEILKDLSQPFKIVR